MHLFSVKNTELENKLLLQQEDVSSYTRRIFYFVFLSNRIKLL